MVVDVGHKLRTGDRRCTDWEVQYTGVEFEQRIISMSGGDLWSGNWNSSKRKSVGVFFQKVPVIWFVENSWCENQMFLKYFDVIRWTWTTLKHYVGPLGEIFRQNRSPFRREILYPSCFKLRNLLKRDCSRSFSEKHFKRSNRPTNAFHHCVVFTNYNPISIEEIRVGSQIPMYPYIADKNRDHRRSADIYLRRRRGESSRVCCKPMRCWTPW